MQLSLVIWGTHYHLNTVHSPHHITIRWCRQYIGMSAWSRHSIDTPTAGRAHCLFILSLATQWTYFLDIFPLNSPFATSTVLSVYFAPQITFKVVLPYFNSVLWLLWSPQVTFKVVLPNRHHISSYFFLFFFYRLSLQWFWLTFP